MAVRSALGRGLVGALAGIAMLLAAPVSPAGAAELVFSKGIAAGKSEVWIAAADGSGARRLANGSYPRVSPDGTLVAYTVEGKTNATGGGVEQIFVVPAAGGAPRLLATVALSGHPQRKAAAKAPGSDTEIAYTISFALTWSPDSRTLAIAGLDNTGGGALLVDVASGATRKIGGGSVGSVVFSPDSNSIADVSADGYLNLAGLGDGIPHRSTGSMNLAASPAWGPAAIAFLSSHDTIGVVSPDGRGFRRLALGKQILQGGVGVVQLLGWSGNSIVAGVLCIAGCESRIVAVDASSGAVRSMRRLDVKIAESANGFGVNVVAPVALSRDGSSALGQRVSVGLKVRKRKPVTTISYGVVQIPLAGNAPIRDLANGGLAPDWNL